jgi:hypothetical protein
VLAAFLEAGKAGVDIPARTSPGNGSALIPLSSMPSPDISRVVGFGDVSAGTFF